MINGKRIAIDARMIEMSGIGTYIQHLMGKGIYDIALGDEKLIRKYDQTVKVIPFYENIYSPGEQLRFPYKKLKEEKIDLIHFPHYNVPFFYHGRYVVTVHDLIHLKYPQYLKNNVARVYARALMKHAVNHADQILTVSECSRKDLMDYFDIPEKKITVTYNAADQRFCVQTSEEILAFKRKYHLDENKKIILYVGNLKPHKNLNILLEAYARLKDQSDFLLILAGKSFDRNQIRESEEKLGINHGILTTGPVDNETLVSLYNAADIFVMPSLYEGFGIPPLEAMACGTPVICSDTSSLPEVVGDAAILFDPLDADGLAEDIERLSSDAELYKNLIKKGFDQVKKFDWNTTVSETKKVINKILG